MIRLEPIKGKKVILREFELKDAQQLFDNWGTDEEVSKYMLWKNYKTIEDAKNAIQYYIECYEKDDPFKQYAIEYEGNVVGSINIVTSKRHKTGEIAYCLSKKYWRKGIMSEAITLLVDYYFEHYDLVRISAEAIEPNVASRKLLEKCGFKLEGILRKKYFCKTNKHEDAYVYAIIKEINTI